jgi:hypothetical protein
MDSSVFFALLGWKTGVLGSHKQPLIMRRDRLLLLIACLGAPGKTAPTFDNDTLSVAYHKRYLLDFGGVLTQYVSQLF